jgi:hypothetical protein
MPPIPAAEVQAPALPPIPDSSGVKPAAPLAQQEAALEMPAPPPLQVANTRPNTALPPPANTTKVPQITPLSGQREVRVKALRDGFYKQRRFKEGDEFTVPSLSKVGSWMKCLDPVLEKESQQLQKEKRKAAGIK